MNYRSVVLSSLSSLCEVCKGQPMRLTSLLNDGVVDLTRCPHCAYRRGIPYMPLPAYKDKRTTS